MRALLCALQLGRMFLGRQHGAVCLKRFTSQGLLVKRRKNRNIYHGSFVMWGGGGVANVCIALHMWCAEHCTCGVLHAGRARQNRGPRHTSPASRSCFGVKRSGLLVPPANSSSPPIVPQLMEPVADDAQWNGCHLRPLSRPPASF